MPSLTGLGILSFPFPGTAVPGYRLFRPCGTGPAPVAHRAILPPAYCNTNGVSTSISRHCRAGLQIVSSLRDWPSPGWTACHSTAGLLQYERRVDDGRQGGATGPG